MIKDLLQGKLFGHPLHPMLVHLPIGLFLLSFIFDVASKLLDGRGSYLTFTGPSYYAMAGGVLTALIAAIPGLADYSSIRRDHPARRVATWHMLLNVAVVLLYAINLVLRNRTLHQHQYDVHALPFALSIIGIGVLSFSGFLGGILVYDDGIGVGRHRRRTKTPKETLVTDGVISENDLAEGQSLRADINGTIVSETNRFAR